MVRQELEPGSVIGNYRVVRLLGQGGMGTVYEVAKGAEATPQADAYSLGVMLLRWLTGFYYNDNPGAIAASRRIGSPSTKSSCTGRSNLFVDS